jgi:hypothetical protein
MRSPSFELALDRGATADASQSGTKGRLMPPGRSRTNANAQHASVSRPTTATIARSLGSPSFARLIVELRDQHRQPEGG